MLDIILFFIVLILSASFHEVAHGWAAFRQGDDTAYRLGRLTLNPLAHIEVMGSFLVPILVYISTGFVFGWAKPVPFNPYALRDQKYGIAKVAVAGPLSNFLLAGVFALVYHLFNLEAFTVVVLVNLILGVFNLVPIPPLDGSKILSSLLPQRYRALMDGIERYWMFVILIFVLFLWQFIFPVVSFLFYIITGSWVAL